VPLTIGGAARHLREHVDYRQASRDVSLLRGMEQFFWSDNGVWSWAYEQVKWCYKLALKTEQRVVLRTPQLAGRVDHILYTRSSTSARPSILQRLLQGRWGIPAWRLNMPYAVWSTR